MTSSVTATVASTSAQVDAALAALTQGASTWAATDLGQREQLLRGLADATGRHAAQWAEVASKIKGLDPKSQLVGEEWLSGPYALATGALALAETVAAVAKGRSPVDFSPITDAPGGRLAVKVLPHDLYDRLLLSGFSAEVWTKPGVTRDRLRSAAGLGLRSPGTSNGVGAVLGAGNISSIAPLDVLAELYAHNRVVALKLNPIMDPLKETYELIFAAFIERGFLRILSGGAEVGKPLVEHPAVTHVHLTGSRQTHDAIVFGPGPDGEARRRANQPLLDKQVSSELGGVSPIIVVPGKWSTADIKFQAQNVATMRLQNNGYNCIAGQVVILSSDWPQRAEFLAELKSVMAKAPARPAYYPGSDDRVAAARACYPAGEAIGPRTLILDVPLTQGEPALNDEWFAPVLAVTSLPGTGEQFLISAVSAANTTLAGTLGANVIAAPSTIKQLGAAFDRTIAELRYGCIAINAWTGLGFLLSRGTWGAFPGHTIDDVQSGIGVVHNALLLADTERTVIRGPFRPMHRALATGTWSLSPKPVWFVTNHTVRTTARKLTAFGAKPSWLKVPAIVASALRG